MDLTVKEVKDTAEKASMYFTGIDSYLIDFCNDDEFYCTDANTGKEASFYYSSVTRKDYFSELVRIPWK